MSIESSPKSVAFILNIFFKWLGVNFIALLGPNNLINGYKFVESICDVPLSLLTAHFKKEVEAITTCGPLNSLSKYSGKIIARSANNITLEGRKMVRVALAEFPDIETAKNCYNSEEYVEARKHLENNATREHIIFEGM